MNFDTRYRQLNKNQKEAVDTIDGPVMVVAGPGTGKTELLSMRVANILKKTDTLPETILCLTFTESGADAMRQRLIDIIGQAAYKVAIHTFHSFGVETINQNNEFFYNGADFKPADQLSSYELLRTILDELTYDNPLASKMNGEYTHMSDILTVISELKKSGLTSTELLTILDANDLSMDSLERELGTVFAGRIGATTLSLLVPVAHIAANTAASELPEGLTPLSTVIATSLAHAVDAAQASDSTKPITAWKNQWLEKDAQGVLVFKSRKRQQKLRSVAAVYASYLARMQEAGLYDFDDMILQVVHAMETHPDLTYNLQEKYQYIMVDEFQDTNLAQARILHNLTTNEVNNDRPNILVVGDDDQAIYAFQGADVSNILNFRHAYDQTKLITLTDNYRSTAPILTASRAVITQGGDRLETYIDDLDKTLTAHAKLATSDVQLISTDSKSAEREWLVDSIKQRIEQGESPQSIAILARRHTEIVELLPYFSEANIAVTYERRDNVLENDIVQLMESIATTVIALADGRHDAANATLPALLAHPAWGFDAHKLWQLSLTAYRERKTWLEIMELSPDFKFVFNWFIEMQKKVEHTPLERMLDYFIGTLQEEGEPATLPFYDYFFSKDQLDKQPDVYLGYLEALSTIRSKLREYRPDQPATLRTFIEYVDLHRSAGVAIASVRKHAAVEQQAIHLMTAHKSKGLEFDTVYITGVIDSSWGEKVRTRSRMIGYPENLPVAPSGATFDERLRLFFVAMTRAKKHLIMSYATTNDARKGTLAASFLLPVKVAEKSISHQEKSTEMNSSIERAWYAPLVTPISRSMHDTLVPMLDQYKLSATHLNNFLDVASGGPHYFLINNLLRFPSAMSPSAAYGSAIHSTLQQAHNHLKASGEHKPQEDILRDFEQYLAAKHLTTSEFETFQQRGSDALRQFLARKHDTFSPSQRVELGFSHQHVIVNKAHLTGALDLVDIDDKAKTIHVTDYKTGHPAATWQGKTDYEKIKLHKYKQQLLFYKLLVENSRDFGTYVVNKASLQFVEPAKSGEIISLDITFNQEELETFAKLISVVWAHITSLDLPDTSQYEPTYKGMLAFEADLLAEY